MGHYHIMLDQSLINAFCDLNASVSLQNVSPGPHTLTVVPAGNDHSMITAAAKGPLHLQPDQAVAGHHPGSQPRQAGVADYLAEARCTRDRHGHHEGGIHELAALR